MQGTNGPHLTEALLRAAQHWQTSQRTQAEGRGRATPPCTIAISREAGALGSTIGKEVATRLGWQLYDQELLNRIGAEMGLRASLLQSVDEHGINWVRDLVEGFRLGPTVSADSYVRHLVEVVGALARHGECVIVGRGAPHILPAESTLRVRLLAPRAFRIGVAQRMRGVSAEEAARWVDETDRERMKFVKQYFHKDGDDPALYDLLLNVSRFTVNQCASLIIEALRHLEDTRRPA
jgi:cytidylate kinase